MLLKENNQDSWDFNKNLVLTENYLTKDAILSANLTEDFTGDANWMIYSTARRLPNGNTYYPELTEAYMLYCMEHNMSSWFSCGEELTLSEEFLNYIKEEDKSLGIQIYDKDLKYYTGYYFSADRLENWDGNPVKLVGNCYEELDTAQYAKYFTKEPVRAYKINKLDENVSKYLNGSLQITGLDKGFYKIYRFDETTQRCSSYSSFTINDNNGGISYSCTEGIYLVTDAETANSHNIKGVYSGEMNADTTGYTLIRELKATDNSSEYVITPEFKALVEQAPANSTIKGYLKNDGCELDTDICQLIKDKNISLEVMFCNYDQYWIDGEYIEYLKLSSIKKFDADDMYGYISGYSNIHFGNYESSYAPDSLLNGIGHTWRQDRDGKYYVGDPNGTKFYVYNCNYEQREYELLDEVEVAFGYATLKTYEVDSYILTNAPLERTTWTADEEYTYTPPTKTDGDADKKTDGDADKKPDDTETPSTPDTPNEPDVPSVPDKPSKPSTPDTPNNSGKTDTPSAPVTPVTPDVPNDNVTPATPETPSTPSAPDNTDTPSDTETPDTPDVPGDTETPDVPGDTETPDTPDVPGDTETPETPDNSQENNSDNNESNDNSENQNSNVTGSVSVGGTTIIDKVPDNIVLPTIKQTVITNEKGKASAPSKVKASSIVKKGECGTECN